MLCTVIDFSPLHHQCFQKNILQNKIYLKKITKQKYIFKIIWWPTSSIFQNNQWRLLFNTVISKTKTCNIIIFKKKKKMEDKVFLDFDQS